MAYVDRTALSTAAAPSIGRNNLEEAVRQLLTGTDLDEKHGLVLYACLAFTVTTRNAQNTNQAVRSSPFVTSAGVVTKTALSMMEDDGPAFSLSVRPVLAVKYDDQAEFRRFCDSVATVMFHWLNTNERCDVFLNMLLSREGLRKIKILDISGTTLKFTMMRPIIGKYIYGGVKFAKQRQVNLNAKQVAVATAKQGLQFAIDIMGVATGSTSSDKIGDYTKSALGATLTALGAGFETLTLNPLWNNIRAFLARSNDILTLLSQITDEVLRQQRTNELKVRELKQQMRERFDREETLGEVERLKTTAVKFGETLLNQVLDVSCNLSLGFYAVWKLYTDVTGDTKIDPKGEVSTPTHDAVGEDEVVRELLDVISDRIQATSVSRFSFGLKQTAKKLGKLVISDAWLAKVEGAYNAYEQDLRDGMDDVQLALSTYRLRIDAENSLYQTLKRNFVDEQLPITRDAKTKTFSVGELPSYDRVKAEQYAREIGRGTRATYLD